jgi:hypothetical protein
MSLNFITGPDSESDLFLKSSKSTNMSQVDGAPRLSAKENRLVRKHQLSVSTKLIIFCITSVLTSENRKPNFHLSHMLGLVSLALSHTKTLNEKNHQLWKACDKLSKHRQHL